MTTINISLPKDMLEAAKKVVKSKHYASISELMRDALRKELKRQEITENGFTREFEDQVLMSAGGEDSGEVWEKPEDIDRFFDRIDKEIREEYGKSKISKKVRANA